MTEPRLASEFWVRAYLSRLRLLNIPAFVSASGDPKAGSVLVKVNSLDGSARVFQRSFDLMSDKRVWVVMDEGDDAALDEMLERQRSRDPDLWIVEVEDRNGRHLLDEAGLDG